MTTYNHKTGEFERDGKKVCLNADGAFMLVGWMSNAGRYRETVRKNLKSFAEYKANMNGTTYTHEDCFYEPATPQ